MCIVPTPFHAHFPQAPNLPKAIDTLSNLVQLSLDTKLTVLVIFVIAVHKDVELLPL